MTKQEKYRALVYSTSSIVEGKINLKQNFIIKNYSFFPVETLHRKGANLNDKNKEFLTPLHLAVDKSHYDVIDVLLKCRAKVNALDSAGQTALHRAARDGNVQACRMLLSAGADPSIVSLQG